MVYMEEYDSRICIAYMYQRLYQALDSDDIAGEVCKITSMLAENFEVDTGVKIGIALGWGK